MTFCGCGYILSDELWATLADTAMIMIGTLLAIIMLYRCRWQATGYHKPDEKCRHFSYLDISLIRYGTMDKGVRII